MDHFTSLKNRFLQHPHRHPELIWDDAEPLLLPHIEVITAMEASGGEPDIVVLHNHWYVVDMAQESPKGRRSCCYDQEARLGRKKFPPHSSVLELADGMGIQVVDETMYHELQAIEPLDVKTSSWILTDSDLRKQGGALFGDSRYGRAFVYHNGADSYYESRGFRGYFLLK
jgi:hypothetical protein